MYSKKIIYILVTLFFLFTLSLTGFCDDNDKKNYNIDQIEKELHKFIKTELTNKKGGVYSNYYTGYHINPADGQNHQILSESMGLYLRYLYFSEEKKEFEKEVLFIKKHLLTPFGLLYWRLNENGEKENSSASIDDLRIIRYLLLAGSQWNRKNYIELALTIATGIKKYCVEDNILVDGASWDKSLKEESISKNLNIGIVLSYADLYTITLLEKFDKENSQFWRILFDNMLVTLIHGYKDYYFVKKYNIRKKSYIKKKANPIINIYTILHLTEIGFSPIKALTSQGIEKRKDDSVAYYALLTLIFINMENNLSAEISIEKMLEYIIPKGPLKGCFGYYIKRRKKYRIYAFDNLLALTALKQYQIFKEKE